MLEISGLDIYHGNIQVVWDLSLTVNEGEMVTLIGPNGSGKTTTVETIAGLNKNGRGMIRFNKEDIFGMKPYAIFRKGLALVPE